MFLISDLWVLLALASGIVGVTVDTLRKQILTTSTSDGWVVIFRTFLYVVPCAFLWWLTTDARINVVHWPFFICGLIACVLCEVIAQWHFQRAIKELPLSFCRPLMEMTVIVMIPLSALLLHMPLQLEMISAIALFMVGAVIIQSDGANAWLKNIAISIKQPAVKSIGYVVMFWSMTTVLQKLCLQYASPQFFTLCIAIGLVIGVYAILRKSGIGFADACGGVFEPRYCIVGACMTLGIGLQYSALASLSAHPSSVVILKRTAQFLYMLVDKKAFALAITPARILGNVLIFLGVLLIAVLQIGPKV